MQLVPLHSGGAGAPATAAGGAAALKRSAAIAPAEVAQARPGAPLPAAAAARQRGLSNWDHGLQREVAGAQQALDFLDQGASQLQGLKSALSAALALRPLREGQLESRVRQFSDTWQQRARLSGGTLDAQLDFSGAGAALQPRAAEAALDPAGWHSADADGLRQTLQHVVKGLARFRQSQEEVRRTLAGAAERAEPAQPADAGIAMAHLATRFADAAGAPGYAGQFALHSALAGVGRERVTALLALRR